MAARQYEVQIFSPIVIYPIIKRFIFLPIADFSPQVHGKYNIVNFSPVAFYFLIAYFALDLGFSIDLYALVSRAHGVILVTLIRKTLRIVRNLIAFHTKRLYVKTAAFFAKMIEMVILQR